MSRQRIAMQMLDRGERARAAHAALADVIGSERVDQPDEAGIFEVDVDAADQEAALQQVWNAVGASGADDHIAFAEHPSVKEHWRPKEE